MSSQDPEKETSPPKKPPVGGVSMLPPGIAALLKNRKGIEAPPSVSTDRDGGSRTGMLHKDSDKERVKSTSMTNLLSSDLSTVSDSSASNVPADSKRRSTQEVSGAHDPLVLDVVRATHSYNAEFEDELRFEAGDIIEVLEKQSEDEGWWRGRIRGTTKQGLFPDNFVVSVKDSLPSNENSAAPAADALDGNMIGKSKEKEKEKEKATPALRPTPTVHPKPSRPPPPVHPKPPFGTTAPAPVPSIPPSASASNVNQSAVGGARESRQPETPSGGTPTLDDVSAGVVHLQHFKKPGGPQGRRLPSNPTAPPANTAFPAANNLEVALRSQPQPASGETEGSKTMSVQEKRQSFPARGGLPVFPPAPSGDSAGRRSVAGQAPNLSVNAGGAMSSSMYAPANSNGGPVLTAPQEHLIKLHSSSGLSHSPSLASHSTSGASHPAAASGVVPIGEYVTREEYDRDMSRLRSEIATLRSEIENLKHSK